MEYGWGHPLKLYVTERSTSKLKPKQEWNKIDNETSEPILGLFLAYPIR